MMRIIKLKMISRSALVTSLCLLLCACRADDPEIITPEPAVQSEEPDMLFGETEKTPEQVLLERPVDDTHDAFLIDTGGELGPQQCGKRNRFLLSLDGWRTGPCAGDRY